MKEINVTIRMSEIVDAILLHTGVAAFLSLADDKGARIPVFSHAQDRMLAAIAWEAVGRLAVSLVGRVEKVERQGEPLPEGYAVLTFRSSDAIDSGEVEAVAKAVVIDCAMESLLASTHPAIAAKYESKGASLASTLRGMLLPDMSTLRLTSHY